MDNTSLVSSDIQLKHFELLRNKINARLEEIGTRHAQRQIEDFPWLYGALGQVPSDVMFVCENPSLTGVERAHVRTVGGGRPTIEDQWCGGPKSNCIKRFRPALCEMGLKTTGPLEPGGWCCYITNVIKEADVVRDFISRDKQSIALEWADVLRWEIQEVNPTVIFTVGNAATELMRVLQTMEKIPRLRMPQPVMHYSNRGRGMTDKVVRETITNDIRMGLGQSS